MIKVIMVPTNIYITYNYVLFFFNFENIACISHENVHI